MRSAKSFKIISFLIISTFIFLGVTNSAFGQGKGHGKNKGSDDQRMEGGDQGNRGQKPGYIGRGNGWGNDVFRQQQGQGPRPDSQPNRQWQQPQPQPRVSQQWPTDRGRGNRDNRYEKQERRFENQARKQERRVDPQIWARQFPEYRNHGGDNRRVRRGDNNGAVIFNGYPQTYPTSRQRLPRDYGGYRNYGEYRSNEVHRRNERRKAERSYDNYRWYDRDRDNRYSYGYYDRANWRDNMLRMVVTQVFNGGDHYQPQNVYDQAYVSSYQPVYQSTYYGPQYQTYYVDEPYRYSPLYVVDPYYSDVVLDNVGGSLFGDSSVGGFISQIFRQLLANGYDDGYQAGQYARSKGFYDDRSFYDPYDPYVYENVTLENIDYNPYSCLGENRRYLSEGYELGYQDGLRDAGQNEFAGIHSVDLVSEMLGNIL